MKEADRLDLSVEALVVDESQAFHELFSALTVTNAGSRLREHGWEPPSAQATSAADSDQPDVKGLYGGKKTMTTTATWWYLAAVSGLRLDQVQVLNTAMEKHSDANHATHIGGNHVLLALVETGLYQRVWPGSTAPSA